MVTGTIFCGLGLIVVITGRFATVVPIKGCTVVVGSISFERKGQHTPGTNKLLKHKDCLRFPKFSSSCGQSLKSSQ